MPCRRRHSLFVLASLGLALSACGERAIDDMGIQRELDYGECVWNQDECEGMSCAASPATEETIAIIQDELAQMGVDETVRVVGSADYGEIVQVDFVVDQGWISTRYSIWGGDSYGDQDIRNAMHAQLDGVEVDAELVDVSEVAAALASCDADLRIDPCDGPQAGESPTVFAQVQKDECTQSFAWVDAGTGELISCAADVDTCSDQGGGTPLVLRFDDAPVEMTAAPADAAFDIDGDGACITHDWPTAATPWLALDRDRNGHIDSGAELFGSGTLLPGGERATQGFEALAMLDTDGDGRITRKDARFEELVLWGDEDGDKVSSFAETPSAASAGLISIDLSYRVDEECDARGNCGVERAAFTYLDDQGRMRTGEVVDLHLACQ